MSEQVMNTQGQDIGAGTAVPTPQDIGVEVEVPTTAVDVLPLNCETALQEFPEAERQEIIALSESIDVRKLENVMNYGAGVLRKTFEQCGAFLKDERGSAADQKVIEQVREIAKKASESYEDFNLVLQEPGRFQQFVMKLMNGGKNPHRQKIEKNAATSYKLLEELSKYFEVWLEMMKKAYAEIERSRYSDRENIALLEKYIIAGQLAVPRVEQELVVLQEMQQQTGLHRYSQEYKEMREGLGDFKITLANLEKSRIMYELSLGQLALINRGNRNVQRTIYTQRNNIGTMIGQQLRNGVFDAKSREVLEGHKSITRLGDELIKEVSKNAGKTVEETERLIYAGFYNMDAAKEAVSTVINSCHAIEKTAEEMLPKMRADMTEIEGLIKELESCIGTTEPLKLESGGTTTNVGTSTGLKF